MGRRLPSTNVIAMFPLRHYSSFMSGVFEDSAPSNQSAQPFLLRSYGRIGSNSTKKKSGFQRDFLSPSPQPQPLSTSNSGAGTWTLRAPDNDAIAEILAANRSMPSWKACELENTSWDGTAEEISRQIGRRA
jgi:hypothetical protein